ncbi:hypothetical protein PanNE5_29540 [Pandoraea sp. NE5]|uniref:transcriptional regulator n=1 Tax=Pandoraea sp. NE5 TaxID=2904129 RepID=UPI0021C39B4A|nr:helix-turn-helix domain-containing protein [Pandoraea sp. NE5]BDD93514.1 hypothetical protein PanNE5_29540 [Pandoraea sp. NE5]
MDLKTYLSLGRGRLSLLSKTIGAHAPDVSRWASGERPIPVHFGAPIETATGGLVSREEMFPDTWATIWPELVLRNMPPDPCGSPPAQRGGEGATADGETAGAIA